MLVDANNFDAVAPVIFNQLKSADFVGLDCETQDDARHEGLNQFCGYDPVTRKKSPAKPLVFDMRRMVMTGFSVCTEGNHPFYINLNHADEQNRVPFHQAVHVLNALPKTSHWLAHNAPFELTVFKSCYNYDLANIICTMQMCVSAYGPHEYSKDEWLKIGQGGIAAIAGSLRALTQHDFDPNHMSPELEELVCKIIAKESDAHHSYNGLVDSISYGYGLKDAVKFHFGHQMTTFEQCLRGSAHMGELTGPEVADYGGEDAYWVLPLFRFLLAYMAQCSPGAIDAFFNQENPMVHVFSQIWRNGMRVNTEAILRRRDEERAMTAETLRKLKVVIQSLLPFPDDPNKDLVKYDSWYQKGWKKYRQQVEAFAHSSDASDDFEQCHQVRGAVSNAWAAELGEKESKGINLTHYMPMRTMLYDLAGAKHVKADGKTQSDGEARGRIKDKSPEAAPLVDCINGLAGIEQRMKLYLTPYTQLMDPETGHLYPVVNSMLATRRMAARFPNPMQLAKRGESRYVRGFFEADHDDHVIVSIDWSGIELVEIGEFSGDPEFIKAFGQLPHADLHSGAASDILSVEMPDLDENLFRSMKKLPEWDEFPKIDNLERLQTNLKGEALPSPAKAYGYWRTEIGKGANFNYWYSGWLGTVGERMGWDDETTKLATGRYRERFRVAEDWRLNLISQVQRDGYITLRDGHKYVRYEATQDWALEWRMKFILDHDDPEEYGFRKLIEWLGNKIQKRAYNQTVNADIQGTCATIAKRSILRVEELIKKNKWPARFMMPIHDELLWSVHRDLAPEFVFAARDIMITHPDLFQKCKLDASPAIGLTFEPWDATKAPRGQIELFEPPKELGIGSDRLDQNGVKSAVQFLYDAA